MTNEIQGAYGDFSAEERQQISEIRQELDLSDSVTAVEYGIGCQRRLAEFADRILDNSGKGAADTSEQLMALLDEIKSLDPGAAFSDGLFAKIPLICSRARRVRKLKKALHKGEDTH